MRTFTPRTSEEVFARFRATMEPLGFTHWSQGSNIGAIGRIFAEELSAAWTTLSDIERNLSLSEASGIHLDNIGLTYGIRRHQPTFAHTIGSGPVVQFTNNGGTQVTISAGTRVWNPDVDDIAFLTVNQLVLESGQQGYVDVHAVNAGETHNVAAGQLTVHNAGMTSISVTNIRAITGGAYAESDERLRYRISLALTARSLATPVAIESAVLAVPGVKQVIINPLSRGNGTLDVIVVPISRVMSNELRVSLETVLENTVAAGTSWRLIEPVAIRIDAEITLVLKPGYRLEQVKALVDLSVRGYIDNLDINDGNGNSDLIYNELVSRVQGASSGIIDSQISLSREGNRTLSVNLSPEPNQRFISGSIQIR